MKGVYNNTKYNINIVRELYKDYGLILDNNETYINNKHRMLCYTKEGYKCLVDLKSVINKSKIMIFHIKNPYTMWNIKNIWLPINAPDYKLLSNDNEYVNANKPNLIWINTKREDLGVFNMSWGAFLSQGSRHPKLKGESSKERLSTKKEEAVSCIKNYLERTKQTDWYINEKELKDLVNKKDKILFYNIKGYKSKLSYFSVLESNSKLSLFSKHYKEISIHNIKLLLNDNKYGYKIKENQVYKNNGKSNSYVFICPFHGEFESGLGGVLKNNMSCQQCYNETYLLGGENHHNWKGGISSLSEHLRDYIKDWKLNTLKECNFKCIITGSNNNKTIHHLYGFDMIIKETMQELNLPIYQEINKYTKKELKLIENKCIEKHHKYGLGVVLTEKVHKMFHSIYGYGNNTPEQFYEFKNNYFKSSKIS